jgi:hypothetical protein
MGTLLSVTKTLTAIGADGYGNVHQAVGFSDTQLTTWAKQFPTYSGELQDFVDSVVNFLCAQMPTATATKYIIDKLPPNAYEWDTLNDAEKLSPMRIIINTALSLADYQLA